MRIYLAAQYPRREELCEYRNDLIERGHVVTSRWLDGKHSEVDNNMHDGKHREKRGYNAYVDIEDVVSSDLFVMFSDNPGIFNRGGRHVEFGMALILPNIKTWIVGPLENIFHYHRTVRQFENWQGVLAQLRTDIIGD